MRALLFSFRLFDNDFHSGVGPQLVAGPGLMTVLTSKTGTLFRGGPSRLPDGHALLRLTVKSKSDRPIATNGTSAGRLGLWLLPREHTPQTSGAGIGRTNSSTQGQAAQAVDQQAVIPLHTQRRTGGRGGEGRGVGGSASGAIVLRKACAVGLQRRGEAGRRRDGRRGVGAQVRKGLGGAQVLCVSKVPWRVQNTQESRRLASKATVRGRSIVTRLAEVDRCCAVQPPTGGFGRLDGGRDRGQGWAHIRARHDLEHLHLTLFPRATRSMAQTHVMSKRMHRATMNRGQIDGEEDTVTTGIFLEEQELGIV